MVYFSTIFFRFGWLFRMTVLVSVHSGETTAVQVLSDLLRHSKTNADLNIFVQMQCEIEFYYQDVLKEMLKKCVSLLSNSNATGKPQMVRFNLSSSFSVDIKRHYSSFVVLLTGFGLT